MNAVIARTGRFVRRTWERAFPPRAIRIPGKFPWKQPAPLAFGTVLLDGDFPVIADGKGGIVVGDGNGAYLVPAIPRAFKPGRC